MVLIWKYGRQYKYFISLKNLSGRRSRGMTAHQGYSTQAKIMVKSDSCHTSDVILITGGAGFLGQHVVKMFQEKTDYVSEIRILDLRKYENYLGHHERIPVKQYIGSVTDKELLNIALHGVKSVIHIAGLISYGTFPDVEGMERVNVRGTENIIHSSLAAGVERLVLCSTVDVAIGFDDIIWGDEMTTRKPDTFLFPGYPETKFKAEEMVLQANGMECNNGKILSTLSLRANVMYGEGDPYYVSTALKSASQCNGRLIQVGRGQSLFQQAYVGNAAWAFVCADRSLKRDTSSSGQAFYIPDDTTIQNAFQFMKPFLESRNFKLSSFSVPFCLLYWPLYHIERILHLIAPAVKINLGVTSCSTMYINMNLYFNGNKARKELGYYPLFSEEESLNRSMPYYRELKL